MNHSDTTGYGNQHLSDTRDGEGVIEMKHRNCELCEVIVREEGAYLVDTKMNFFHAMFIKLV